MTFTDLLSLFQLTARDPVEGARQIVAARLPQQALWLGFGAVISIFVILATLTYKYILATLGPQLPPELVEMLKAGTDQPLLSAAMQAVVMVLSVVALDRVGRYLGGVGDFDGALAVAVTFGIFYNLFVALQLLMLTLFPILMTLAFIAGFAYLLWLAPGLVMGLHGFRARLPVLLIMIVTFLALNFALAFLAALLLGGATHV